MLRCSVVDKCLCWVILSAEQDSATGTAYIWNLGRSPNMLYLLRLPSSFLMMLAGVTSSFDLTHVPSPLSRFTICQLPQIKLYNCQNGLTHIIHLTCHVGTSGTSVGWHDLVELFGNHCESSFTLGFGCYGVKRPHALNIRGLGTIMLPVLT